MEKINLSVVGMNNSNTTTKKEVIKLETKNGAISLHGLILQVNEKWNSQLSLAKLEAFLVKEAKLKTSDIHYLFTYFGIQLKDINFDTVKSVLPLSALVDSKGKDKKKFSPFTWLKSVQKLHEQKKLRFIFDAGREALKLANDERIKDYKALKVATVEAKPEAKPEAKKQTRPRAPRAKKNQLKNAS